MSGRSCSSACADFFERQAGSVEEDPDRTHAGPQAPLRREALLHLEEGDVIFRLDEAQQKGAMGIKLRALRLACGRAVRSPVSRARRTQTMAVAIPIPNRAAAWR